MRTDSSYLRSKEKKQEKQPRQIRKVSKKRLTELDLYRIARRAFLTLPENQMCAVFPWLEATEIHHKKGKEGPLLYDSRFFLAVSRPGHEKIEMNPDWAKEMKFSLSRTAK